MTNAEKFEEIFGIKPDEEFAPFDCPYGKTNCTDNWLCTFANETPNGRFECRMDMWWSRLYKENENE